MFSFAVFCAVSNVSDQGEHVPRWLDHGGLHLLHHHPLLPLRQPGGGQPEAPVPSPATGYAANGAHRPHSFRCVPIGPPPTSSRLSVDALKMRGIVAHCKEIQSPACPFQLSIIFISVAAPALTTVWRVFFFEDKYRLFCLMPSSCNLF